MAESALSGGFRPFTSLIGGAAAGQQLVKGYQENEARRINMEDYEGRKTALTTYAETGETKDLMKYDPAMVMKLDDAQAKRMEEGIGLVYKAAPFLVQQAGDPRAWDAFAQDLEKFKVPSAIVEGFRTGTPEERVAKLQSAVKYANDLQIDLTKRKTDITVGAQKELETFTYKNVTEPKMRLDAALREGLQTHAEEMKEKYAKIADNRTLQKEMMSDLTRVEGYMTGERIKAEGRIDEQFSYMVPNPKIGLTQDMIDQRKAEAKEELRRTQIARKNALIDSIAPILKSKGIEMPAKEEMPLRMPTPPAAGQRLNPDQRKRLIDALEKARPPQGLR